MQRPSRSQVKAAGKLRRGRGKDRKPPVERVGFTLAPGSELYIDFGRAHGHVVLSYPLEENPVVKVYDRDVGEPRVFEFQRVELLAALERISQ